MFWKIKKHRWLFIKIKRTAGINRHRCNKWVWTVVGDTACLWNVRRRGQMSEWKPWQHIQTLHKLSWAGARDCNHGDGSNSSTQRATVLAWRCCSNRSAFSVNLASHAVPLNLTTEHVSEIKLERKWRLVPYPYLSYLIGNMNFKL